MTNVLKPRKLGGIITETFRIYRRNFWRLILIVAIVEVFLGLLSFDVWTRVLSTFPTFPVPQEYLSLFKLNRMIGTILPLLAYSIAVLPLMGGALIHAVSEQYLPQPIGIRRAYRFAWSTVGAMIVATILAGLAILGMSITIIGIPIAIYFGVRWAFILQVASLEGLSPRAALSRSSALVKGTWWRVLGIMLVVGIIAGVIGAILQLIPIVGVIIGGILTTPISVIGITLLYYDLRVRKEGYNLKTLSKELHVKKPARVGDSPERIARGLAIGVFWGIIPTLGLAVVFSLVTAVFSRANKFFAVLGTLVANPLTLAFIYSSGYKIGHLVLRTPPLPFSWKIFSIDSLLNLGKSLLVGNALLAIGTALTTYFLAFKIISTYKKKNLHRGSYRYFLDPRQPI